MKFILYYISLKKLGQTLERFNVFSIIHSMDKFGILFVMFISNIFILKTDPVPCTCKV